MIERRSRITSDEVHITGDNTLIIPSIIVLPSLRREPGAMAAVVEEQGVAGPGAGDEVGDGAADVGAGGLGVGVVGVDEDDDIGVVEAVAIDEAAVHAADVVNAALELGLGARVVAPHQHRFLPHDLSSHSSASFLLLPLRVLPLLLRLQIIGVDIFEAF